MTAKYRAALQAMAVATDGFAHAMEKCASLKGPTYEASTRLQGAAGMHYLVGNNWSFLAETLDRNFERPLRGSLEEYRRVVEERSSAYERELRARSQVIRETEMGNMNKKQRNLQSFREALTVLQRQVDELDDLKIAHYQEIVDHEVEVWEGVQNKVCLAVRSTMEVFDKITTKSSDPILEQMLQSVPDPFDAYRPPPTEFEQSGMGEQIFSILPPLSIISNVPSALPSPSVGGGSELSAASSLNTSNSMMGGMKERHNSWPGPGAFDNGATEWAEVSSRSPSPPTPPRSASPPGTRKSHHLRKSESKMRNVLTVIDESQSHTSTGLTRPPPMTNSSTGSSEGSGGTIRAPPSSESRPSSDSRPSLGSSDSRQGSGQWFGTTKRNSEPGSAGTSGSTSNSASSSWIAGLNGLNDPPWNTSFGTEAEAGGYGYGESPYGGEQGSHGGEKGPYGDENGTLRAEDSTPSRTRRGELPLISYLNLRFLSHSPTQSINNHLPRLLITMPAKKRCQLQSETPCNSAVLRIVGECPHCRSQFCGTHRLPEHHNCNHLEDCRQAAFDRNKAKLESERTVASKMTMA